jgi:hypothetical protein
MFAFGVNQSPAAKMMSTLLVSAKPNANSQTVSVRALV